MDLHVYIFLNICLERNRFHLHQFGKRKNDVMELSTQVYKGIGKTCSIQHPLNPLEGLFMRLRIGDITLDALDNLT